MEEEVSVDVLIVGGGITGLATFDSVTRSRGETQTVLLVSSSLDSNEPTLGAWSETLHSHGYLHSGYLWPPNEAKIVTDSKQFWCDLVSNSCDDDELKKALVLQQQTMQGIFSCPEAASKTMEERWTASSIPFQKTTLEEEWRTLVGEYVPARDDDRNNSNRVVYRSDDRVFDPEALMRFYLKQVITNQRHPRRHSIVSGEAIELVLEDTADNKRQASVIVRLSSEEKTIRVRPKTCVLTAGSGNWKLLKPMIQKYNLVENINNEVYQYVKEYQMVVLRGDRLPSTSFAGFFADKRFMIAAHGYRNPKVWFITYFGSKEERQTKNEIYDRQHEGEVSKPVIQETLTQFFTLCPHIKTIAPELEWSYYCGSKIDTPNHSVQPVIQHKPFEINNLIYANPILWTNAVRVAQEIERIVGESTSASSSSSSQAELPAFIFSSSPNPKVAQEKYKTQTVVWKNWNEFTNEFGLSVAHSSSL